MLDQAFREKGERLTDEPKERCSREVDHRAVIDQSEEDPSMSCRMLAGEFDCDLNNYTRLILILRYIGTQCLTPT
ncbi:hypothetical protein KIN20_030555 [Parelaphostrongylus tenuis]|uniref:Uncharacterized protein n=1 Tax=Parelaphostrongylus tenuis TaxID=148309 RepID=A0AAD5R4B0_PARTN|nr:hypothetical protein KIN20_030555 [Parelaphostrongylus tenuis]